MSRRVQENIIAAALLIVFVAVIAMCFDYGPRARMVPLPVAVFGLVLLVMQIAWQNLRPTEQLHVDFLEVLTRHDDKETIPGETGESLTDEAKHTDRRSPWRGEAVAFGIVAVFLGLILLIGPIPAVFIFTGGYLLLSRHYPWFRGLIYTVIFTAALYLLFVVALELQLYHGLLEPLVERFR